MNELYRVEFRLSELIAQCIDVLQVVEQVVRAIERWIGKFVRFFVFRAGCVLLFGVRVDVHLRIGRASVERDVVDRGDGPFVLVSCVGH